MVQAKACIIEIEEEDQEVEEGMEMRDKQVVQMRALHGEAKDEHHEDKTLTATISAIGETESPEEKGGRDNNLKANTAISKLAEIFLEARNLPPEGNQITEIITALAQEETHQMEALIES